MKRANNRDRGFGQSRGVRPTIGSDDRATAPRAPARSPLADRLRNLFGRAWPILPAGIALLGFHGPVMAMSSVIIGPPPVYVLPTGGQVSAGTASIAITPAGDRMNIVQASDTAIINWSSFSIGAGATVNLQQPSAASATLNRVTGTDPSSLLGTLSANGKVWLINQAGIMVGPNGRVDVAEFVASTLQVQDADFLAQRLMFFTGASSGAAVQNQGSITAGAGGGVYLVGGSVDNRGAITAPGGEVGLVAGQMVMIDPAVPGIKMRISGWAGDVSNLGQIVSDAGKIGLVGALVSNGGVLNASSAVSQGGQILLTANGHVAVERGSHIEANANGGRVDIEGESVSIDGTVSAAGVVLVETLDGLLNRSSSVGKVTIGGSVTGGNVVVDAVGIALNSGAALTASAAIGNSVILDAGTGDFTNNSGSATPITLAGTARSLIYTGNSTSAVLGGMTDRPVYGKTFTSYAPAAVTQAGNRILYADAGTPYIVAVDNAARNYGDANPALTVGPFAAGSDTISGSAALSTPATVVSGVGKYPINATQGRLVSDYNLGFTFVPGTMTVAPRPLSIAAQGQTKIYGNADPVLGYAAAALVNGDTLTGALARTAGENVGSYGITQGSLSAGANYAIDYSANTLVVTPAALAVRANNQGRAYRDANPALDYVASGLKFSDSAASVLTGSLATSAGAATNVGFYPITQGNLSANPNYALRFSEGSLAITARPLSVVAAPATKVYGDADPVLAYAAGALVNGDALTGALARNPGENAGSYGITQGSLTAGPNYAVGFTGNTLSVTPATLTYVAAPASRPAGESNPVFSGTVTGFRFGQSLADVSTTQPVFASSADPASPPGRYPIDGGGVILSTSNYRLVQAAGNAEALTVGATRSAVMGNEDPAAVAQDWAGAMSGTGRSAPPVRLLAALTTSTTGVATTTAPIMPVRTDPLGSVGGGAGEFGGLATADSSIGSSGGQLLAQRSGRSAASAADLASTRVLPSCTYLYGRQ